MKFLNNHFQKLENALRAAYHDREHQDVEISGPWQSDVMRDVRRVGPLNRQASPLPFLNQFVWRFATVACVIVLMLSVYVGFTGFNPVNDVADLFLDNPVEFTLTQILGDY